MEPTIASLKAFLDKSHSVYHAVAALVEDMEKAGAAAADFVLHPKENEHAIKLHNGFGISYTVPQQVRVPRIEKSLEVFFRVRQVFGESVIEVKDGESLICSFKREYIAPGEMQQIKLPRVLLDKVSGTALTISVKEA